MRAGRRGGIITDSESSNAIMKISADRLAGHLDKSLASVYLICGDEPLLVDEAADRVRARARAEGFDERERHVADAGFAWDSLGATGSNMSLFASRKLVEVRLPTGKPGQKGGATLAEFAANVDADTCLIVIAPKLDKRSAGVKWVKAMDKHGVIVQIWPVDDARLPAWIGTRMRAKGLVPEGDAVEVLADRVQGNLLAADQEIEKLLLLNGPGKVDGAAVARSVADSARFDVFALADSALLGDVGRAMRILDGLHSEGVAQVLVLWALARDIRTLSGVLCLVEGGASLDHALARKKVWSNRTTIMSRAARRIRSARNAYGLLQLCAQCDAVIKGRRTGDDWQMLAQLVIGLTGATGSGRRAA